MTCIIVFYMSSLLNICYCHFRIFNKSRFCDPIDYESIEDFDYWVMEDVEEDPSFLCYEEIDEDLLYDDTIVPKISRNLTEDTNEERSNEADVEAAISGIKGLALEAFQREQEDVDMFGPHAYQETHAFLNQDPPIFDNP